jgi:Mrp family chromosome partitioning ATPase
MAAAARRANAYAGAEPSSRFAASPLALSELSREMAALAARLGPAPGAVARVVQFVAPEPGEGASTLARAFACEVAKHAARPVWLVELDLMQGDQYEQITADPQTYGRLGEPKRASPNNVMFFSVQPTLDAAPGADAAFLAAHAVGGSRLYVTRFRRERLSPGQVARILPTGDYWQALAAHSDYVVIDAPAWSRSRAAGVVAPFVDANLMVLSADRRNPDAAARLRQEFEAAGGDWTGVVMNRAPRPAPGFIRALAP